MESCVCVHVQELRLFFLFVCFGKAKKKWRNIVPEKQGKSKAKIYTNICKEKHSVCGCLRYVEIWCGIMRYGAGTVTLDRIRTALCFILHYENTTFSLEFIHHFMCIICAPGWPLYLCDWLVPHSQYQLSFVS